MSLISTNAVVIKTQDYKENDKLVWLFTEKYGKITAIAKGAKKSKSKLFSLTLPLCFGEYDLFKGKNLYTLQEGKLKNSFQGLLNNLDKLTFSSYLCELVDIAYVDGEKDEDIFINLITTLYLLDTDALDYELLIRAFELKLLKRTGYGLNLDNCVYCKKKIGVSNYISISSFGGVCDTCPKNHGIYIQRGSYNALKFLQTVSADKVYRLNATKEIKMDIEKVNTLIISNNYARRPKSLEMLNYLKE